jgi:hypothetical protein
LGAPWPLGQRGEGLCDAHAVPSGDAAQNRGGKDRVLVVALRCAPLVRAQGGPGTAERGSGGGPACMVHCWPREL